MGSTNFRVDKKRAKVGDWVTVSWDCDSPDAVSLTVDNGFSSHNVQLADSGSYGITITKSNGGKTTLRLNVVFNGKVQREEVEIKVEGSEPEHKAESDKKVYEAEPPKSSKSSRKPFTNPLDWLSKKWNNFNAKFRYGWSLLPERKRRIYKTVFWVIVAIWLFSIAQSIGYKAGYQRGIQDGTHTVNVV
ncbi:MAG: hypothetical protein MJZ16_11680 [Bacteroidales bacterium]|nr:hypothetical protein [Bacteroidales bacterium]